MPYTQYSASNYGAGDYYRYQAGGIFGSIGKAIGGAVSGFMKGGPLGAIGGAAGAVLGKKPPGTAVSVYNGGMIPIMPSPIGVPAGTPGAIPKPGVMGGIQRLVPGGKSGYVSGPGGVPGMSGYHLNKSGYWTMAEGYIAPGTKWVKNRSTNPGNARALRRAIRREQSFIALAKRALKGTGISVSRRQVARKIGRKR